MRWIHSKCFLDSSIFFTFLAYFQSENKKFRKKRDKYSHLGVINQGVAGFVCLNFGSEDKVMNICIIQVRNIIKLTV